MLGYQNIAKLKNWKTPWGLNDFVTVCYALCLKIPVQSVPSSKSQTLAPQCLLPRQLRPSKGVESSCSDVAHDLKLNNGEKCWDRFSIPRWWKPTIFDAKKNMARFANSDCCWHILLDVKIDLVPNLHSAAKSAGSWVQEQIERDTAALNLHSSYWRNATGPLEQYHNERPPAAPETKTFQGWNGHRSYIKLYIMESWIIPDFTSPAAWAG